MGWICESCNKKYSYRKPYLKHISLCKKNNFNTIEDMFVKMTISEDKKSTNLTPSQRILLEKAGLITPISENIETDYIPPSPLKSHQHLGNFDFDIDTTLNNLLSTIQSLYLSENVNKKILYEKIINFKAELKNFPNHPNI